MKKIICLFIGLSLVLTGKEPVEYLPIEEPGLITSTEKLHAGQPAKQISVDVSGLSELWLEVSSVESADSVWANPVLIDARGKTVDLTTLTPEIADVERAALLGINNPARLKIGTDAFEKGFDTRGSSLLHFKLDQPFVRFEASVGISNVFKPKVNPNAKKKPKRGTEFRVHRVKPLHYILVKNNEFAQTVPEIKKSLRLAIDSIETQFGNAYPGEQYLAELEKVSADDLQGMQALQRKALLANPALGNGKIIAIKSRGPIPFRKGGYNSISGRSAAHDNHSGFDNEIILIEHAFGDQPKATTLFRPERKGAITDLELDFDGKRIAFAMSDSEATIAFRVFEYHVETGALRQLTPDDGDDVDHSDPCYLPDGGLIFASSATFLGMPCIMGRPPMASLFRLEPDGKTVRQLGFDQDSSWYPVVREDGTVMYTRWDYSDMVHSNNRPLMVMRPDGSGQKALALSNSYFPNAFFFARPIPGKPSQVVGIASGHHEGRNGKLLILDTEVGHKEEEGFIHQIPGYGEKVERVVRDPLNYKVTNQMMHPYPLAEKGTNKGAGEFFLAYKNGGIYLVDIYDNQLLIYRENGCSVREPIPFEARETPPVLASSIKPESDTATLYIQNLYHGPGLKGVPRGTIRKLRIGAYQFSPRHSGGGHLGLIGVDSGWDIKKVIGEVPVEEDGSVNCEIPSKTPLFFQPLDENGRTLQGMRTWVSAMGGEFMSCVGCHESPNDAPPPGMALAMHRAPSKIEPWQGKSRPMSFRHEIQPILDAKCISCHDAEPANGRYQTTRPEYADGIPDLRGTEMKKLPLRILGSTGDIPFSLAYWNLMPHVYRPGIESPMDVPTPGEYGAVTSELTQILRKGHHGVVLSDAEWGRFNTWMDFNAPYYGYRREIMSVCPDGRSEGAEAMERAITRGNELAQCYAGIDAFVDLDSPEPEQRETLPIPDQKAIAAKRASGTVPFNASVNQSRLEPIELKLSGSEKIELVPIPAGRFVMGSANGELDELPMHENVIKKPFYMASKEISNAQFRLFMKEHNSGFVDRLGFQFGQECVPVNGDELPAVRVSWVMAMEFCEWLSNKTGKKVSLPTEAQWEWAARAGQDGEFWFGNQSSDFAPYANLADKTMEHFAECTSQGGYKMIRILKDPNENEMWIPHTKAVNDGQRVQCAPGHYKPNPWGLYDMHGNVSEWTRSAYQPYPYQDSDDVSDVKIERVVRGGSYRDRPYRATASHRQMYRGWHRVHDVGFRVIVEQE